MLPYAVTRLPDIYKQDMWPWWIATDRCTQRETSESRESSGHCVQLGKAPSTRHSGAARHLTATAPASRPFQTGSDGGNDQFLAESLPWKSTRLPVPALLLRETATAHRNLLHSARGLSIQVASSRLTGVVDHWPVAVDSSVGPTLETLPAGLVVGDALVDDVGSGPVGERLLRNEERYGVRSKHSSRQRHYRETRE